MAPHSSVTETTVTIIQHPPAVLDLEGSLARAVKHIADSAAQERSWWSFPKRG